MRVFLSGIMQGSLVENGVHAQDYRAYLTDLFKAQVPGVEIYDPWAAFPDSLSYGDGKVEAALIAIVEEAARSDLVIAYLPQASMGTALEMWEAWRAGVPVIAITPLEANWVVRTCASWRFDSLEDFSSQVRKQGLDEFLLVDN
ncbi:MAG: hypothetical protein U9R25_12290 [Chloroflexota bacterium]|nr:hypothetical protein [Chloroflexota bacterium]